MNGVIIIDKPAGLTSHDVVNRVRRILGQRAVGHLGTLDPSATGVLPIVLGNLTRLAQFYAHSEKTYEGVIRFGFATDTYDADGEPTTPRQESDIHCKGGPSPGRRVSRHHRADAAAVFRQENCRSSRLQTSPQKQRSRPQASPG